MDLVDATFAAAKKGALLWALHDAVKEAARFLADLPTRLIGDRGYDSDALDRQLMTFYGIEMIAAHRRGRHQPTQDGRCLRRARRRWKVERLFAWLHNFRRLVTRWERHVEPWP